jgi:hypothetical protein
MCNSVSGTTVVPLWRFLQSTLPRRLDARLSRVKHRPLREVERDTALLRSERSDHVWVSGVA